MKKVIEYFFIFAMAASVSAWADFDDSSTPYPGYPGGAYGCVQKTSGGMICINDLILDSDNDLGTVVQVFQNGQAQVRYERFGNQIYTMSIERLFRQTQCWGNVCAGQTVIDNDRDVGFVENVFENGKARVRYERYGNQVYAMDVSRLSPAAGYPNPYPNPQPTYYPPAPYPQPLPTYIPQPQPLPTYIPQPPVGGSVRPCFNRCIAGEACSDGCPIGGVCTYQPPFYIVRSCSR